MRRLLLSIALLAALPGAARAEPSVSILPLGFAIEQFRGPGTRVAATAASTEAFRDVRGAMQPPLALVWGKGGAAALTLEGGAIRILRAKGAGVDFAALERGDEALPDSRIAGAGAVTARLEMPSRDYAHEGLGSAVHARVVAVTERKPAPPSAEPKPVAQDIVRIPAGEGAVFEDREPRLSRIGGDAPAILVVHSYRDLGSALALIAKREGKWKIVAETPPDGAPYRWLNPVAGGEGAVSDIALVRRPDLDGLLQVWRLEGDKLVLRAEKAGYSNHVPGSPAQDLAAWFTAEDGSARLAIPVLDRSALALLSVGPEVREIARIPLPAKAAAGIAALGDGRETRLVVGLEDGRVAEVRP